MQGRAQTNKKKFKTTEHIESREKKKCAIFNQKYLFLNPISVSSVLSVVKKCFLMVDAVVQGINFIYFIFYLVF